MRQSVNVQRLFKFSGNLPETQRGFVGGTVALHFAMYNEPYGGSAHWQETQNVHPDAEGGYTVLLGETTMGGLPADLVAPVESTGWGFRFQDNRNNHACCWWKCLPRSNPTP